MIMGLFISGMLVAFFVCIIMWQIKRALDEDPLEGVFDGQITKALNVSDFPNKNTNNQVDLLAIDGISDEKGLIGPMLHWPKVLQYKGTIYTHLEGKKYIETKAYTVYK